MDRTGVVSSNLVSVGYDQSSGTLEVEFRQGRVYQYSGVPPEVHEALMSADSHGKYFAANIRNTYSFKIVR